MFTVIIINKLEDGIRRLSGKPLHHLYITLTLLATVDCLNLEKKKKVCQVCNLIMYSKLLCVCMCACVFPEVLKHAGGDPVWQQAK